MRNVAYIFIAALACCTISPAQFQFGSVVGLIKDASQAPVPGATIEIRSQSTNVARQATASPAGEYNFVSLPPDKYTITVKHPGFRDTTRALELSREDGYGAFEGRAAALVEAQSVAEADGR